MTKTKYIGYGASHNRTSIHTAEKYLQTQVRYKIPAAVTFACSYKNRGQPPKIAAAP